MMYLFMENVYMVIFLELDILVLHIMSLVMILQKDIVMKNQIFLRTKNAR